MNDMITIPVAEYERLNQAAEMLSDVQAFDRASADLAAGTEALIPHEFVTRMIEGESPVKVYREFRGHSQTKLAELSGVNRVQIADIEAGRKGGSVATLGKLADALDVLIDDLA